MKIFTANNTNFSKITNRNSDIKNTFKAEKISKEAKRLYRKLKGPVFDFYVSSKSCYFD